MGLIVFTATGCISEINPVGGLIAGSAKAVFINKGLQIIDGVMIESAPVFGEYPSHPAQYMGSQMPDPDPGQYQKSAVIGQKMKVRFSQPLRPADVSITASDVTWC
jgi:hypothetical protein